jgi:hypothetical protein
MLFGGKIKKEMQVRRGSIGNRKKRNDKDNMES